MALNVKFMIRVNAALFTAALIGEVVLVTSLTKSIWIQQPLYNKIVAHKDLTADVIPPALLLRELRGEIAHALRKAEQLKDPAKISRDPSISNLEEYYNRIQEEYGKRIAFWSENAGIEPETQKQIREKGRESDANFLNPVGNRLIPALKNGNLGLALQVDREIERAYSKHIADIDSIEDIAIASVESDENEANASMTRSTILILLSTIGILALSYYALYRMQNASVVPLGKIAGELSAGSDQFMGATNDVASASQEIAAGAVQVATASQRMAEGASEQAAAVEQTSASLEEMSSMIHSSAKNAEHAKTLASEAQASASMGNASMEAMSRAMAAIEQSSNEVAKIVKSIDEIAFQTNILALNAAVEAARAGEAGAGFAVVAEEVRSLAQRSAAAAHESSEKIEASILSSREGAECLKGVGASFAKIEEKVKQTDVLVSEITLATKEQAQGIEHITTAIQEMSKVAQDSVISIEQMRRSAEESASNSQRIAGAAEQMRSQATRQRQITAQLRQIIDGSTIDENLANPHYNNSANSAVASSSNATPGNPSSNNIDAHFSDY
jgi:methyl-accepting chemotaxis protein